ncbi:dihydrofolate reductase family protein [Paracidovorax wautersii]|uniref:dihydrofolate reductase family protein n=1 Tax=Paracidovorax wautersii TaxID=1177982 RepID=UPI0031D5DA25
MTEIVYYVAASLDGFIAGPQGELDWLQAFETSATDYGLAAFIDTVDAVAMGRRTCEAVLSLGPWPYGDLPGWVLSHQSRPATGGPPAQMEWGPCPPRQLLAQWQRQGVRRGWLLGGGDVAAQFLHAGCVHRLMLATMPVTLGAGIPLWGRTSTGMHVVRWEEQSRQCHGDGVITRELLPVSAAGA